MRPRVVVIGGGIGGCAAALHLAKAGAPVTLIERSDRLGGLVASFEVAGTPIERAYHHLLPGEQEIVDLIAEIGLSERVAWLPSSVAIFRQGRVWPFTSPLDLVRFGPLPFVDRVRTGLGALRAGRVNDWEPLDAEPALAWLGRLTSSRAVDVVWDPMLRAKFGSAAPNVPAAWMWARFRQRAGGRKRGGEVLGYLRGGFLQMFDALERRLTELGADVRVGTGVQRIALDGDRVVGVEIDGALLEADAVLFCGQLPGLPRLLPPEAADPSWVNAQGLGVVCVVLEMTRPATGAYWINVCDEALPFGGIIEHTNLVPPTDYAGTHIAYLSRYYPPGDPIATADLHAEAASWVDALAARLPGFTRANVTAVHPFREQYAAPLVSVGYRDGIPPIASHLDGLFVSTTAQIYPRDRGMSEGVRMGIEAARRLLASHARVRDGV